jgi:hypothetical protein
VRTDTNRPSSAPWMEPPTPLTALVGVAPRTGAMSGDALLRNGNLPDILAKFGFGLDDIILGIMMTAGASCRKPFEAIENS